VPSSTGGGGVEKNVAIVYTIEGVDQAASDQERLASALGETSEALDESSTAAARAEQATERLGAASIEAGQQAILTQQRISALAAGLSGLGTALGSESELGSTLGRMGQLAGTGVAIGSIFGPAGAVVGGIAGATIPALQSLWEAIQPIPPAINEIAAAATNAGDEVLTMAESFDTADQRMRQFVAGTATASRAQGLQELNSQITELTDAYTRLRDTPQVEFLELQLGQRLPGLQAQADAIADQLEGERRETGAGRRRGGGSASRGRGSAINRVLEGLQNPTGDNDNPDGPTITGLAAGTGSRALSRGGAAARAEAEAAQRTADKQKELHDAQMARIQEQVDAWASAGQKIGSTLYNAFQTAASGQETLEVAVVKGFKNLAIQFGGQMVNEGIGALLTAVGNTVANPPMAATKAAEGAGKLALGIGLGAVGAAIPVPAAGGGSQASTPRLGPQGSGEGGGSRSVIVNMNAPAVITGSRAAVGREIGGALEDARNRFGRASL